MNRYWDNLRPFEKRLLVVVGTVLFVVLNLWFVVPHFSDWERVKARMAKAERERDLFEKTINMRKTWDAMVRDLQGEGLEVPPEDQAHHFDSAVQEQQLLSGVGINSKSRTEMRTNQFFMEQKQVIGVQSTETNLVSFLYNLGAGKSLIRVRDLTLRPDQPHQQLMAQIKLVASYQKNPPKLTAKAATPSTPPPAVVKPAAPAAKSATTSTAPTMQVTVKSGAKTNSTAPPPNKSIVPTNKPPSSVKPTQP